MKKSVIKIISTLFPGFMVKKAYEQLSNPQVRKLREHEIRVLDQAHKETVIFKGFKIQTYFWKGGDKKVLLVHGWEGQAGNFSDLIEKLLKNNYTVYAFDGPSHGFSSKGKTSLFEFTELVGVMIEKHDISNIVSHSFGGVATTFALYKNPQFDIKKYALLTTPDKFLERIEDVSQQVGITQKVKEKLISKLEAETGVQPAKLNVSDFVKTIKVENALIIHDKNDKIVPIQRSKNVQRNWRNCKFIEIEGTGHFRILRTDFVIDEVVAFLN
ncbi:MAG: alpha/beta fold hydrolase [Bacteroidota bacterium]